MESTPLTVLMPVYDAAQFIGDAVRSILNQSHRDFELLIVDDGSKDNTRNVIESFDDSRIRYLYKFHSGLADSLNIGLKEASFDIIARMDADDISHPKRLQKQLGFLMNRSEPSVISCWYAYFRKRKISFIVKLPESHSDIHKILPLYSTLCHPGCIYNKETVMSCGGYRGDVLVDYDLWLRLKERVEFYNIPEVLVYCRYRNNSLSRKDKEASAKTHYTIQRPYYLNRLFTGKETIAYELLIRAKREILFGKPFRSRKYLYRLLRNNRYKVSTIVLLILSYSPEFILNIFRSTLITWRIKGVFMTVVLNFRKENKLLTELLRSGN